MTALRAVGMAFALYSRFPMPEMNWESRSRNFVLYAFPLVGLAVGGLEAAALYLTRILGLNGLLAGALLTAVPIWATGGIHLDGFCDVWDARASCRSRAEKLKILKDSNVGAFAVIHCVLLLLLSCGVWSQLAGPAWPAAVLPVFSRCLAAFGALSLPNARGEGMLASVTGDRAGRWALLLGSALCAALLGAAEVRLLLAPAAGYLTFAHYVRTAKREFGGTTGDLSGWFLTRCELWTLAGLALAQGQS